MTTQALQDKVLRDFSKQKSIGHFDLYEVGLDELVGLLAWIIAAASEDMSHIEPLDGSPYLLCPTSNMQYPLIRRMYASGLININLAHSTLNAFKENEKGGITFYWDYVATQPAIYITDKDNILGLQATIDYLREYIASGLDNRQKLQLTELMQTIAIQECCQIMQYLLAEHNFDPKTDEKTEQLFADMLKDLSVSQVYPCIFSAIKSAAAFLQSENCRGRPHAYNTIHGKIRELAARRLSGELRADEYERNYKKTPRSEISTTLYQLLGYDSDIGFTTKLSNIAIPDSWNADGDDKTFKEVAFTKQEAAMLDELGLLRESTGSMKCDLFEGTYINVRKTKGAQKYEVRMLEWYLDDQYNEQYKAMSSARMDNFASAHYFARQIIENDKHKMQEYQRAQNEQASK